MIRIAVSKIKVIWVLGTFEGVKVCPAQRRLRRHFVVVEVLPTKKRIGGREGEVMSTAGTAFGYRGIPESDTGDKKKRNKGSKKRK